MSRNYLGLIPKSYLLKMSSLLPFAGGTPGLCGKPGFLPLILGPTDFGRPPGSVIAKAGFLSFPEILGFPGFIFTIRPDTINLFFVVNCTEKIAMLEI